MRKKQESLHGKISFITSLVSLTTLILVLKFPNLLAFEHSPGIPRTLLNYFLLANVFVLPLISIIYGILGIRQKDYQRNLAIAGIIVQFFVSIIAYIQLLFFVILSI